MNESGKQEHTTRRILFYAEKNEAGRRFQNRPA